MSATARFFEHDTALHLWLDDPSDPAVKAARDALLAHLRARGFHLEPDQTVDQIIRADYQRGGKGALECRLTLSGRHIELAFFQNVVRENRHGGQYDFDKRKKMPFLIGKQYELERGKIAAMMASRGYPLARKVELRGMDFIDDQRAELAATHRGMYDKPPEAYNSATANKGTAADGDTVYFRHWNKRWQIGTAHHNINNMWWVLLPCGTVTNVASFELHLAAPETGLKGRAFDETHRKRKQMESLQRAAGRKDLARIATLRAILTPPDAYYVISLKHSKRTDKNITLWGQSDSGYCFGIGRAGKYAKEDVMAHLDYYNSGTNIAVDAETVERLVTMSAQVDRDLDNPTPTLRNTASNWIQLLAAAIAKPKYDELPEIFTTKTGKRRKAA